MHRRNEVHDVGSGWKPADGHGTAAEDEGEHGGARKASTVVTANAQWKRGGGRCMPAGIESHVVQFSGNYGRTVLVRSSEVVVGEQWLSSGRYVCCLLSATPCQIGAKLTRFFCTFPS